MTQDTIAACCTPPGTGAIALIRISGPDAISITDSLWKGRSLAECPSHTAHLGTITDTEGTPLDQAVATVFRAPKSFTGLDTVEISCHGSVYIQRQILNALTDAGARPANPGEFSQTAFLNHRIDLAQAEGIADLIAARTAAQHRLALTQTKGEYSRRLSQIRDRMIELASLIELELDFSEEDVTFADRSHLRDILTDLLRRIDSLTDSYSCGQAIRQGFPIAIAGAPNAGKSTLLNTLLADDIAITSDIPGTTRDAIQASTTIAGTLVRFIDTAGLRNTEDTIEQLGIERTHTHIANASAIIWLIDTTAPLEPQLTLLRQSLPATHVPLIILLTKTDLQTPEETAAILHSIRESLNRFTADSVVSGSADNVSTDNSYAVSCSTVIGSANNDSMDNGNYEVLKNTPIIPIDARTAEGTAPLLPVITEIITTRTPDSDIIITNARHYAALRAARAPLLRILPSLQSPGAAHQSPKNPASSTSPATSTAPHATELPTDPYATSLPTDPYATDLPTDPYAADLPTDLIAQDLREAIHHLGTITGAITTQDLLTTIFSRFCVGK